MRVIRTTAIRSILAALIGLYAIACGDPNQSRAADEPRPPIAIQFSLDRPIEAGAAAFMLASARGLFSSEGLAVTINLASGSPDAIARVAAGTSEFALVDINELTRFRDKADAPPIKAVFVLFNQAPYAIVGRKSRGIHALSDIEGKTLGVAESDLSIRLWPALAKQNGIKAAGVKLYKISAAVREPILSAGQVDAVTGFSYLSAVNLRDRGVPADDLAVLRFADYGCEAYGFAVIVNPAFAAAKPEAVKGFLRAVLAGTHLTIKEPGRAVDRSDRRVLQIPATAICGGYFRRCLPASLERPLDQLSKKSTDAVSRRRSLIRMQAERSSVSQPRAPTACPCFASIRASYNCSAKRRGWAGFSPAPTCCWPARNSPSRCCSAASSMFSPANRPRVRWLHRRRGRCWRPGRRSACSP